LRAIDAAVLMRAGKISQRTHIDAVEILRVDDHAANAGRLIETHVFPGLAGISGLVNAVAGDINIANGPGFSGAYPHHVGVGRGHGQRANGRDRLLVKNGSPAVAAVGRLPHAAGRCPDVPDTGIAGDSGDRGHAVADRRAKKAKPKFAARPAAEAPLREQWAGNEGETQKTKGQAPGSSQHFHIAPHRCEESGMIVHQMKYNVAHSKKMAIWIEAALLGAL